MANRCWRCHRLDVQGLPKVINTSNGEAYLHLPGPIITESSTGEVRHLLSNGLGRVRQAVDENAAIVSLDCWQADLAHLENIISSK